MTENIELDTSWGATVVEYTDAADTKHRLWFDETDKGRLVAAAEVVVVDHGSDTIRDYQERPQVPDNVREVLDEAGFETEPIYDINGRPLR